jgi:sugar phosphate isomerase/epimerase
MVIPFKRGVISDEVSQELERVANLSSEFKLDGVELRSLWEKGAHELNDKEVDNVRRILFERELRVLGIASPFFKCPLEADEAMREHLEILKKTIKLAHKLETKIIRGFAFWKEEQTFEKMLEKIIKKFQEPIKMLEDAELILVIESEHTTLLSTVAKLAKFLEILNSPVVRGLWDPGNELYAEGGDRPFPEGYAKIKPMMAHMHLKDTDFSPEGKPIPVPIGEGKINCQAQMSALIKDNYTGCVTLETHWRKKKALPEEVAAMPKGSAFSLGGEEASRICLEKWEEILSKCQEEKC